MKKIYEANGIEKEEILDVDNELKAFDKARINDVGIEDLLMITRVKEFPINNMIDSIWSINGINSSKDSENDIIVLDPFCEHLNDNISNLEINNTNFNSPIKLSSKAIILMPYEKYLDICKNLKTEGLIDNFPIRLYEGNEKLAIKMIMRDKNFIYLKLNKNKYEIDVENHPDIIAFTNKISEIIEKINEQIKSNKFEKLQIRRKPRHIISSKNINKSVKESSSYFKMITGLTEEVEGDISLDEEFSASTDIGKCRDNQEDGVLLIRDKEIPNFKMMVVADGMGGQIGGEIASNVIIQKLKNWFEELSIDKKKYYYNSIENIKTDLINEIELKIQPSVEYETWKQGGSTLVCAIIGKNDTIIANVGDSRAYIAKNGKLIQLSREDTVAQKHLENGIIPTKEASRFDQESNILLQSIGMNRRNLKHPHTQIIKNDDYDLLLLFTDGVTDCLSDDDIITVCKKTDKSELAKKIVEKAIRHDSIEPEEYSDYANLNLYIPGGKDNATVAIYAPKKIEGKER